MDNKIKNDESANKETDSPISLFVDWSKSCVDYLRILVAQITLCGFMVANRFKDPFPPNPEQAAMFISSFGEITPEHETFKEFNEKFLAFLRGNPNNTIAFINIREVESFTDISEKIMFVKQMFFYIPVVYEINQPILPRYAAKTIEPFVNVCCKANEAIGYWTAKMEERKRNTEGGAAAQKRKKEIKLKTLSEWLEKIDIKDRKQKRDLFLKAQIELQCTENNVRELVKTLLQK